MKLQLLGYYYPGAPTALMHEPKAGDFLLAYSQSWVGTLIRFGESIRRRDKRYAWASHAALIVSDDGTLIEALAHGLEVNNISKYANQRYALVRPICSQEANEAGIAWAKTEYARHAKYGWTDIASIVVQLTTPSQFDLNWGGSMICSAFVAFKLMEGGFILSSTSPFVTLPSDLARESGAVTYAWPVETST